MTDEHSGSIYYGWWNVLACFFGLALSYAMFTVFAFGTFLTPLEAEFGWQRGAMSLALTIANVTIIFTAPLLGALMDKISVRKIILVSVLLLGLCVASMSQLNGNIWYYYLMHLLIPLLGAGTLPIGYSRIIVVWFTQKRGLALGISLSGFGVGAALMPMLAQFIIDAWGWREAYLVFAGLILFISFPLTLLLLKEKPEQSDKGASNHNEVLSEVKAEPFGLTGREAMRERSYWLILGSFLLVGIGITSILAHLVPMLIGRGVTPAGAVLYMSALGFGLIFGRVIAGFLMDHFFAPYITALFLVGLLIGIVILASGASGPLAFLSAVLVGLATGSEISEIAYMVSRYFGPKAFGQIYGVMFSAFQLGAAIGAAVMGIYHDMFGNYTNATWAVSVLVAIGIGFILLLKPYPDFQSAQAGT